VEQAKKYIPFKSGKKTPQREYITKAKNIKEQTDIILGKTPLFELFII